MAFSRLLPAAAPSLHPRRRRTVRDGWGQWRLVDERLRAGESFPLPLLASLSAWHLAHAPFSLPTWLLTHPSLSLSHAPLPPCLVAFISPLSLSLSLSLSPLPTTPSRRTLALAQEAQFDARFQSAASPCGAQTKGRSGCGRRTRGEAGSGRRVVSLSPSLSLSLSLSL